MTTRTTVCGNCQQPGHNRRSCEDSPQPKGAAAAAPASHQQRPEGPLRLMRDPQSKRVYERRRWDCTMLRRCEAEWLEAMGTVVQAACPKSCPGVGCDGAPQKS